MFHHNGNTNVKNTQQLRRSDKTELDDGLYRSSCRCIVALEHLHIFKSQSYNASILLFQSVFQGRAQYCDFINIR